jgi:DNA-binding IclR family transcriptional regulator
MNQVVKSAKRVTEIFEYFAQRRSRSNINDVCTALGYPQSSTSMLLHSLVELGYLTYDKQARMFYPTLRIATVGSWLLEDPVQDRSPLQYMEELSKMTGHSIALGIQNGVHVLYIHVIQATNTLRLYMRPGSTRPLCASATGRVLIADRPDPEIRRIVQHVNAEREEGARVYDANEEIAAVERVRERGYAIARGRSTLGSAVIARLIPPRPNQAPMAIGLGLTSEEAYAREDYYAGVLNEVMRT